MAGWSAATERSPSYKYTFQVGAHGDDILDSSRFETKEAQYRSTKVPTQLLANALLLG